MKEIRYIPFLYIDHLLKNEYISAFNQFLEQKQYILGTEVSSFEKNWAEFCQTQYAVGVGNGYDALYLSLIALGIKHGDEVIVPAHTFAATALAIINTGAQPVLVDVSPETFTINPSKIEEKISTKTKAILVVHLYGNPCEMDVIREICKKHNLHLLEDNAQSHGAKYKNKVTGSFGILSATSFYPVKNLGALGDAGIINTNGPELYEKLKLLRNYGSPDKHRMELTGVNSRLDEFQAKILNIKLKYLQEWNEQRNQLASQYKLLLSDVEELQFCSQPDHAISSHHIFPVLAAKRDELRKFLLDNGIHTLIHYPLPYHLQKAFKHLNHKMGDFPVTEKICENEISLPIYPGLSESEVEYICLKIRSFLTT